MAFDNYKVAVKLSLVNDISKGLFVISKEFKLLGEQASELQRRINRIHAFSGAGFKLFGGAMGIAAPLVYAVSKAAELQKQMLGIQIATSGTTAQMDKMRVAIEKASAPTQFSAVTVAEMAKKVATSNSFSADQLTSLMPVIAKFADVQSLLKNTDPLSSVTDAVKMMHLAQRYSPNDVEGYFNEITKASLMMPGGVGELRSALSYYQPMGKAALGVDDKDSIMLVALLSRLGLSGSRGGTNLLAAMTRTIPGIFGSGLLKGKSQVALADMGFIDKHGHSKFMVNGKFNTDKWVMGLAEFVRSAIAKDPKHGRERVVIDFQHAFGTQGGKVASLLSSSGAISQLAAMGIDFNRLASMGAIQDDFVKNSVSQQYRTAVTNFQNSMIELGTNLLPLVTSGLNKINARLGVLIPWMSAHKDLVKEITKDFIVFAAALTLLGTIATVTAVALGVLNPIGAIITGIALAGAALVHFWPQVKQFFAYEEKRWMKFFDFFVNLYEKIKNYTLTSFNQIYSYFTGFFDKIKSYFQSGFGKNGNINSSSSESAFSNSNLFYSPNHTVQVHSTINIDGKQVANAITIHQAKKAGMMPSHGTNYNGNISLQSNMLPTPGF